MQLSVLLDRSRPETLTDQIVEQVREAIQGGRLCAGARLPSSRQLADQLGVSRNTVVRAYEIVVMEGLVDARPASGLYVAPRMQAGEPALQQAKAPALRMPMPLQRPTHRALQPVARRLSCDFAPARPSPELFPVKTWRRLLQRNLSQGGGIGLTQEGDPAGLPALRTTIAQHIAATRGITADPSRIVIVSGIAEALALTCRLYLTRGLVGVVEDPCRSLAVLAFEAAGADIVMSPVDEHGLVPEDLPARTASLLHVTPSHQVPTGAELGAVRRAGIVDWARRHGCYIIEDDDDCDIRYQGSPLPAIATIGPECTIYVGSFAKSLGAGLRLGFMVVPEHIAEAVRAEKALLSGGCPWLEQTTLTDFIRSGSYGNHLLRARAHYKARRDSLIDALRRNFGDVRIAGDSGGLHLLWHLPPGIPDAVTVEAVARRAQIGVYSLASAQARFRRRTALTSRALILGFGGLSPRQIEKGVARLSDAIDDAIDDPATDMSALFSDQFDAVPPPAMDRPRLAPRFRHQPALRTSRHRPARSGPANTSHGPARMPMLTNIYRYPIKGLSAQPLPSAELQARKPFPHDRILALVRPGAPYDVAKPGWGKKGLFVMLMLEEGLARVRTSLDIERMRLTIVKDNQQLIEADLDDPADRSRVEQIIWDLVPTLRSAPTLVRSAGGHFMDKPDEVISLINLATVRSLEQQWGITIDPLRFRANLYIDGASPWEEFDWVGGDIRIGGLPFRVDRRNGRCGATNVDPSTGRRDLDIPGSLRAAFGHKDLGVYLIARENGRISVGDPVALPHGRAVSALHPAPAIPAGGARQFICRGCYFIYDGDSGLPEQSIAPGTAFSAIPASWRCPDCGTDKSTFRPHVPAQRSGKAG